MLDVSIRTVQSWAKLGRIPAVKIGGVVRIPKLELERVMAVKRA